MKITTTTRNPKRKPIRVNMVCCSCGSDDILVDAYAEWDPILRRWDLHGASGNRGYCAECDSPEGRIKVVPYRILPTNFTA